MSATTAKTKVCKTQDELVTNVRVAAANRQPYVYASREVLDAFNCKDIDFDMMGVKVVEDGKLEAVATKYNISIEQFNHG